MKSQTNYDWLLLLAGNHDPCSGKDKKTGRGLTRDFNRGPNELNQVLLDSIYGILPLFV